MLPVPNTMLGGTLEPAASAESVSGSGDSWCPLYRTALSLATALGNIYMQRDVGVGEDRSRQQCWRVFAFEGSYPGGRTQRR